MRRTLRFALTVVDDSASVLSVAPQSAAQRAASRETLARLDRADEERRTREGAKNAVEAYVYATREKLSAAEEEEAETPEEHTLLDVSTAEQREALNAALAEAADWLYDEGADTETETYKARLRALRELGEPPAARLEELRARARLIKDAKSFLAASRATVEGWNTTHPQITANETADATAALDEFEGWFTPKLEAQTALAGHEEPVLTRAAVQSRIRLAGEPITRLSRKPKPTPTPAPISEEGAEDDDEAGAGLDSLFSGGSGGEDAEGEDGDAAADASAAAAASAAADDGEEDEPAAAASTAAPPAKDKAPASSSSEKPSASAAAAGDKKAASPSKSAAKASPSKSAAKASPSKSASKSKAPSASKSPAKPSATKTAAKASPSKAAAAAKDATSTIKPKKASPASASPSAKRAAGEEAGGEPAGADGADL